MKLIVGLGNPDRQYLNTYHNLGYMAIDKVAELLGADFNKENFKSLLAETKINGEKVLLCKPLTYMNLSGEAVSEIVRFYKIDLKDIIVIYDDFDLFSGDIRFRENGSSGTHNGMRNIVKMLGSENFARVRIGFKPRVTLPIPLIDFVLMGITEEVKPVFDQTTTLAGKTAIDYISGVPVQDIMQKYNGKKI